MVIFKFLILILVFINCILIGNLISKKYKNRVIELKSMKNALNILETKIKFTYESLPELFLDISNQFKTEIIGQVFDKASELMKNKSAGEAWKEAIDEINLCMTTEDKTVLKNLGKLLGKTDIDGQINEIELVNQFLDRQIEQAELDRNKNEKMYKSLGSIIGLALVIIFI